MDITSIIEEELNEARNRITQRIANMLLGGQAPASSVAPQHPASPRGIVEYVKTRDQQIAPPAEVFEERKAAFLQYLRDNPGSYGRSIAEELWEEDSQGLIYQSIRRSLMRHKLILQRGSGKHAIYYINERTPQASLNFKQETLFPLLDKRAGGKAGAGMSAFNKSQIHRAQEGAVHKYLEEFPKSKLSAICQGLGVPSERKDELSYCTKRLVELGAIRRKGDGSATVYSATRKKPPSPKTAKKPFPEEELSEKLLAAIQEEPGMESKELAAKVPAADKKRRFQILRDLIAAGQVRQEKISRVNSRYFPGEA